MKKKQKTIEEVLESVFSNDLIVLRPPLVEISTVVYEKETLKKWIPKAAQAIKELLQIYQSPNDDTYYFARDGLKDLNEQPLT